MKSAFSSRVMAKADWSKIKYFDASEFSHPERMGYEFMQWLDAVREKARVPIIPFSDYRTPQHNTKIGGAPNSAHTDEIVNVVDIKRTPRPDDKNWNLSRFMIIKAAIELGCTRIGTYPSGSLHVDRTEDIRPFLRCWVMTDNLVSF